jgi:hypothetical protein
MSKLQDLAARLLKSLRPKFPTYHCEDEEGCNESCETCTSEWIESEAQAIGLDRNKVQRLKSLTKTLMEIIREEGLSLRPPQVDADGEGGLELVWMRRKPSRTVAFEANNRGGIDAMLIDGQDGVNRYEVTHKDIAGILRWYAGKSDDMGMRKHYDFSEGKHVDFSDRRFDDGSAVV